MKPLGTGDPLRLGPYRLLGVLGEGGMGKVYLGQDSTGQPAAVKVLRPELAHEHNLAARFVREAQTAQAVTSGGVARVLGADTEGGRPWIATEFLAGPTLDEVVSDLGPFGEPAVRALAASLARTLADIHAAGLVHRDLKPPNIILTSAGPRVIDFGIARPEHGLTLTTTGQIPVTPGYGAPEQVLGRRVAPSADVFSLGAVLIHAASGHRAFQAGHVAALQYEVVHGEPVWDDVPETLRALIAPLLAKDPAARPAPEAIAKSCAPPRGADRDWRRGPLAEDIKKREEGVRALLAPTRTSVGLQVSRRRLLTGFAAGGTVLATAGGTAAWLLRSQTTNKPDLFAIPPAVKSPAARVLSADEGDFVVGDAPKPLWGPVRVLHADSPAPLPVRDVIVFGAAGGGLAAHNVVDGKRRWAAADVHAPGRYLSLSDRLIAAVGTDGKLLTFVPSTGEPKWTAPAEAAWLLAADDEAVYLVTKDRRVRAVGRSDARIRWTVELSASLAGKTGPKGVAGRGRLVVATAGGDVVALDTRDGRQAWDLRSQSDGLIRPAVADDTVYLNGRTLTARALADGKERWTAKVEFASGETPPWGPPTVHGEFIFAMHGKWPRRLNRRDGGTGEWEALFEGGRLGPILAEGTGVWTIADTLLREVQAVDVESRRIVWRHEQKSPKNSWITADGNRVFVIGDAELTALPVF
ncbi:serine/threonine-protein kinase [Streptomyces syringium]|uniref:serine/threonine-protein kinase n=1 Tax=Streptomyces syringium TaxID=76729 RepID=UPI003406DE43